ncbi:MAG TPA: branched-chain amino acid transaminase [Aggregatilineales bacterium]|nr:branched-chain amino acid transaminase [Aggregatilineales bacterium]
MAFDNGPYVWFDGKFVEWDKATVHVTTHALHYGSSVFEGIRCYETPAGPAIFRLEPHVTRLLNSCKLARIDMPWSRAEVFNAIVETVARNGQPSCYIRPLVFRGSNVLGVDGRKCPTQMVIFNWVWGRYLGPDAIEKGVDVGVSAWRRLAPGTGSSLAKIGGQYINSQWMKMQAVDDGYSEAIALDVNGNVSEGSGENIFLVLDGVLYTPPLASSILSGITRHSVMTIASELGLEVHEQVLSRDMLYIADEAFFTGTAAEITAIRSVDRVTIGNGARGPVTKTIAERFFEIVSGKVADQYGWLTPVKAPAVVK